MSPFVTLDSVAYRSPDGRDLLENLDLALGRERTGLVGRNGVGKSTLVRLILGELQPAAGAVTVRGRLAVLRQVPAVPPGASLAEFLGVAEPLARLDRLGRGLAVVGDLEAVDWALPGRLAIHLNRMGLSPQELDRPWDSLSGGEATRAALAAILVAEPDLILLDEPTNNLDAEGREAVAELLEGWTGGALVISHDRQLLRRMDRIVELSGLGARVYGGGYDLYAARQAVEASAAARDLENAQRDVTRVAREAQTARERKARADVAGRRSRARGDAPRMLLDARAERAENTGARQSRIAQRLGQRRNRRSKEARERVDRARLLEFHAVSHRRGGRQAAVYWPSMTTSALPGRAAPHRCCATSPCG